MWPPETGHDWEKLESPEARIERGKGYQNFMRTIRVERMFACERCGVEHNQERQQEWLHIHHIVKAKTARHLRFERSNIRLLCQACHKIEERNSA
jgi:hypothetical protein